MDDQIRVSDADRERVTARLRDHYAEGRLTDSELDERVSAALSAKTFGDLRPLMADLPVPPQQPAQPPRPQWGGPPWMAYRRGPRLLPVILLVLLVAAIFPGGGWMLAGFFHLILLFWLFMLVTGLLFGAFRRRTHRHW